MKVLKYILGALAGILILGIIYVKCIANEDRPEIIQGEDAELLATKMLTALNKPAWDTLPLIKWTFRDKNNYVWDKRDNKALIQWDDMTVHLDPDEVTGNAYQGDEPLLGVAKDKAIAKAWSNWCNDMFWLAAPYKIKDPGTTLAVARDKQGEKGLLVTYESGGVTPGDSYLWFLDEEGIPTGYKMWVSIIPVGGLYTTWQDWKEMYGGAKIAQNHVGPIEIPITNLASGDSWDDLGYAADPIQL